MPDDLDQLIRAAMKTLDDEVPSGYFEALPNRTIARLEGSSMQHGSSGTTETRDTVVSPPPLAHDQHQAPAARPQARAEEEREDSGLHDIRNLAQSTKQRLSSRRITAQPVVDDVLASSSGSFKNIALPQPAKMVSLPEIADLPSKTEVAAAEKTTKKAAKEKKSQPQIAAAAAAVEAPAPAAAAPARQAFSLPSQQKKSKRPLIALLGTGLAAAAGAVIYLQMDKSADTSPSAAPAADTVAVAPAAAPAAEQAAHPPAPPPAPVEPPPVEAPKDEPAAAAQIAADEGKADDDKAEKKAVHKGKKADKEEPEKPDKIEQKVDKPDPKKATAPAAKPSGEENEPSFDQLLKEAGVAEKKETKPKLDKKSLTGDDFKKGMAAVIGKAKGCYNGTQGTAMIKLTIAPSGQVSKVAVTGEFAGKPEASCVESAIKGATFPPWDGGPQSFTYSVLLSD